MARNWRAWAPKAHALLWGRLSEQRLHLAPARAFSVQSVGRLASTLTLLIRNYALALPDDPDELANLRLRETSPGVLRIDHDPDKHDDRANRKRKDQPLIWSRVWFEPIPPNVILSGSGDEARTRIS